MDLLVNKVVPLESNVSMVQNETRGGRHTETGGGGSRRAGGRSERHYHTTQTGELREASCFLGLPKPLNVTRFSTNLGELDDRKRTPLWHLDEEKFLAFLGFRDVGGDERILPSELALSHSINHPPVP